MTPAFPGYISGHSTFSRAAAEAVTAFTGSKWFPKGLATYTIPKLINEVGPTQPVTLQWASYYDAADQVGLSRIWGGIHPPVDDFAGRRVGAEVGKRAWELAQRFFDGSVLNSEVDLSTRKLSDNNVELRYTAVRGLYYRLQSSSKVEGPYTDAGTPGRALEASIATTNSITDAQKFFRVSGSLVPDSGSPGFVR